MTYTPELGQLAFSNARWQPLELEAQIEDGLTVIAQAIAAIRQDGEGLLVSNYGAEPYESSLFAMRTYCWCGGVGEGHEDDCPPNFEHYRSGLAVSWYKHVGRGGSQNKRIDSLAWFDILRECLDDVLTRPEPDAARVALQAGGAGDE